jgi:thiol-disulfide isomerase/thioredoxin
VPLAGRRVAVIGTGSTASQLIPPIAAQAGRLHRVPAHRQLGAAAPGPVYNRLDHLLAHFPPYARTVRWCWTQILEWGRRGFDEGTLARKGMLKTAAAHRRRQLPDPALREKLTPPYPLGCKRLIYSSDFYPAMSQPNVELVTDAIERITEGGIVTADGQERAIDVLVCATGFETVQLLSSITVTGLGGRTLRETWANGPEAFHGISVAGFPNMFLSLGPNTATGHTSTLLYIEPETQHSIACMQAVLKSAETLDRSAPRGHARAQRRAAAAPGRLGLEPVPQLVPHAGRAHRGAVPRFHRRIRQGRAASEPERLPHGLRGRPRTRAPTNTLPRHAVPLSRPHRPAGWPRPVAGRQRAGVAGGRMGGPKPREARPAVDGADGVRNDAEPGRRPLRPHPAVSPRATPSPRPCCWACSPRDWGTWRLNWQAYADSPASVIDIRDGGWNLPIGVVAGLAWLLRLGWRTPTQRPALAAGAVVGLVIWGMGLLMQQRAAPAGYPEVALVALKDGQPATLAQAARGRPVVVNLWASWCGPCRVEMPDLADAQRRHPDIGFLFVNQGESAEKVQAFLARSGLALDEVWLDQGSRLGQAIRSPGLPTPCFSMPRPPGGRAFRRAQRGEFADSGGGLAAGVKALRSGNFRLFQPYPSVEWS